MPFGSGGPYRLRGAIRVDRRQELRAQLAERECALNELGSNAEYLLAAWHKWVRVRWNRWPATFRAQFCEEGARTLWCACDFVGARPFYYTHLGSVFVSATPCMC